MCFYVNKNENTPLIADTDIICYKVGDRPNFTFGRVFQSGVKHFKYVKGKIYGAKLTPFTVDLFKTIRKVPNYQTPGLESERVGTIEKGFHSYISAEKAGRNAVLPGDVVARFVIPAGSGYYKNSDDGTIVSDSIQFEKILRPDHD